MTGQNEHCGHECCNQSMRKLGRDIRTDDDYVCVTSYCPHDTRLQPPGTYPLTDVDIAELIDYADAEDAAACIKSITDKIKTRRQSQQGCLCDACTMTVEQCRGKQPQPDVLIGILEYEQIVSWMKRDMIRSGDEKQIRRLLQEWITDIRKEREGK